jgi:hypothetical protein
MVRSFFLFVGYHLSDDDDDDDDAAGVDDLMKCI